MNIDAEWLICARVATAHRVVKGSRTAVCERCGEVVWVAPSGQAIRAANTDIRVGCMQCVPALDADAHARGVQPALAPLTPEQVAEVEAFERGER